MKELKKDIKNNALKPCYVFWGEENYLKKYYAEQIKKALLPGETGLMNFDAFENNVPVDSVMGALSTYPFMSDKRLVIVNNSRLFISGRKEESERISNFISDIPDFAVLIFVEEDVDKRGKLYKSVSKYGYAVEFKTPSEKELITWVKSMVKAQKMDISSETALHLIRYVGMSMDLIYKELFKIFSYKENTGLIVSEDVDNICIGALETKIFGLVDAIGNKNAEKAVNIYHNLILFKESPVMVLSMIIRQFRLIYQCKLLAAEGESNISARLSQRSFVIDECLKQSKNFTVTSLTSALKDCLDTDIQIKTGRLSPELAVEILIMKYA